MFLKALVAHDHLCMLEKGSGWFLLTAPLCLMLILSGQVHQGRFRASPELAPHQKKTR